MTYITYHFKVTIGGTSGFPVGYFLHQLFLSVDLVQRKNRDEIRRLSDRLAD